MTTAREDVEQRLARARDELSSAQHEVADFQDEVADIQQRIDALDDEIDDLDGEVGQLEDELAVMDNNPARAGERVEWMPKWGSPVRNVRVWLPLVNPKEYLLTERSEE